MVRLIAGSGVKNGSAGLARILAALLIMLSGTLVTIGQNVATNPGRTGETAANPTSESTLSVKSADSPAGPANYTFLMAEGVVCDSSEGGGCPAVVKSANGDGYRLGGAGTFDAHGRSATGAGTFTHGTSRGVALETGVWVVEQLLSFDWYGLGSSPILKDAKVVGETRFGPRRMPGATQSTAAGGRAIFRIRMLPIVGPSRTATLEINCPLGQPPAEHQVDGIKLALEGGGLQFEEQGPLHSLFVVGPTMLTARPRSENQ